MFEPDGVAHSGEEALAKACGWAYPGPVKVDQPDFEPGVFQHGLDALGHLVDDDVGLLLVPLGKRSDPDSRGVGHEAHYIVVSV